MDLSVDQVQEVLGDCQDLNGRLEAERERGDLLEARVRVLELE